MEKWNLELEPIPKAAWRAARKRAKGEGVASVFNKHGFVTEGHNPMFALAYQRLDGEYYCAVLPVPMSWIIPSLFKDMVARDSKPFVRVRCDKFWAMPPALSVAS